MKEISLWLDDSSEAKPEISWSGLPSSSASINSAICESLKIFSGDTKH